MELLARLLKVVVFYAEKQGAGLKQVIEIFASMGLVVKPADGASSSQGAGAAGSDALLSVCVSSRVLPRLVSTSISLSS